MQPIISALPAWTFAANDDAARDGVLTADAVQAAQRLALQAALDLLEAGRMDALDRALARIRRLNRERGR